MKSLFLKGLEKKGPIHSSKTAVMLGMRSKKLGFQLNHRKNLMSDTTVTLHTTQPLLSGRSNQESVIGEPMKGEKYYHSIRTPYRNKQKQNIRVSY